jgi:hypothetical protein
MVRLLACLLLVGVGMAGCFGREETAEPDSRQPSGAPPSVVASARSKWDWVQRVAERAGYRIVGETGSALIAEGAGRSFYIWPVGATSEEIRAAARRESWPLFGRVGGVKVYGDEAVWRWWVAKGFVIWLSAGPDDDPLPTLPAMAPLVRASRLIPPP